MTNELTADQHARLARMMRLLAQDPLNSRLRQDCVDLAVASKDFESVLSAADIALRADTTNSAAQFDRATGLIGLRRYLEALDLLRPLKAMDRESFGIGFNIALCLYCLDRFQEALPMLEACYERGLRDAGLLRLLVRAYHHMGQLEAAVRVCTENPEPALGDATLAGVYALLFLDTEEIAHAAKWAAHALQLDPTSIDARVTQGNLLIAEFDTKGALAMFQGVVTDAPGTGRAWIGLGSLALLAQDFGHAAQSLSRALELMPDHAGSWHMLGWTQLMQKDLKAADVSFTRAAEIDQDFAETHGALAATAAIRGDREQADRLIQLARGLDPECLSATFAESVLARRDGDVDRAVEMINAKMSALGARRTSELGGLLGRARKRT